jgi:hypothetical protein
MRAEYQQGSCLLHAIVLTALLLTVIPVTDDRRVQRSSNDFQVSSASKVIRAREGNDSGLLLIVLDQDVSAPHRQLAVPCRER